MDFAAPEVERPLGLGAAVGLAEAVPAHEREGKAGVAPLDEHEGLDAGEALGAQGRGEAGLVGDEVDRRLPPGIAAVGERMEGGRLDAVEIPMLRPTVLLGVKTALVVRIGRDKVQQPQPQQVEPLAAQGDAAPVAELRAALPDGAGGGEPEAEQPPLGQGRELQAERCHFEHPPSDC